MIQKIKTNLKKALIVIGLVACAVFMLNIVMERPTHADSGFSTSHSSSHSSKSSSKKSSSKSSSSKKSSSKSSSSKKSSSKSSSSGSSGGSSEVSGWEIVLGTLVFVVALFFIISIQDRRRTNYKAPKIDERAIEKKIKQYIPDFDKAAFLNNCYTMYCDIQKAWMDFKLEDVKDILTDELYTMYESQLATLEVKGEQNIMKDFVLKKSYLKNVINQNDTITITTGFVIEFYDYIAEQGTGKLIRGDSKHKMRVTYEMKFRQTLDQNKKVDKCPNCGAHVDVNSSGFCSYCRTKLVTENTKWVLTQKQALSQTMI